jgi:hypothetical protein
MSATVHITGTVSALTEDGSTFEAPIDATVAGSIEGGQGQATSATMTITGTLNATADSGATLTVPLDLSTSGPITPGEQPVVTTPATVTITGIVNAVSDTGATFRAPITATVTGEITQPEGTPPGSATAATVTITGTVSAIADTGATLTAQLDTTTTGEVVPPDTVTPPDPVEPPPAGTLRATVTMAGATFVFDETAGVDLGDYHDPDFRFTERCTRVTRPDTPIRIDVRRMEGRVSVVFGQGFWQDTAHYNLPEYDVTIEGSELRELVTLHCPYHSTYQRWRWCSAEWPFPMRTMVQLYAAKLLPRFDPRLTRGQEISYGHVSYEIMGLAGLCPYMPQTGGRGDIGHLTAWQGSYVCHENDPACLADVIAQGEAAATYTWDYCDSETNAVIDPIAQYPQATQYNAQSGTPFISYASGMSFVNATVHGSPGTVLSPNGSPPTWNYLIDANRQQYRVPVDLTIGTDGTVTSPFELLGTNEPAYGPASVLDNWSNVMPDVTAEILDGTYSRGSGIVMDSAHQPACSYLPLLLTGDPYYLENLQRQAVFIIIENPSAPVRGYGVGQPRAAGWSARTLASAAKVSPQDPPSWLLPKSLFLKAINDWADNHFYPETVANPSDVRQILHLACAGYSNNGTPDPTLTWFQFYQEDICLGGLSWLALLHPDTKWPEIVKWHSEQTMARLDPQSGWSLNCPTGYFIKGTDTSWPDTYDTWGLAWEANAPFLGMNYSDTLPIPNTGEYDYWSHMSAGMAIAWQAGCQNAEPLTRLLTAITTGLEQGGGRQIEPNRAIAGPVS